MTNTVKTLLVMAVMLFSAASCGGGGGVNLDPTPADNTPAPGTADLSGTLTSTGGIKAFSQTGSGFEGALITLINTLTGGIAGIDLTNGLGEFEFKGVPSGDFYLLKIEFQSTEDLDGDGHPDEIELYFPLSLADQAVVELLETIGVVDADGDGDFDDEEPIEDEDADGLPDASNSDDDGEHSGLGVLSRA